MPRREEDVLFTLDSSICSLHLFVPPFLSVLPSFLPSFFPFFFPWHRPRSPFRATSAPRHHIFKKASAPPPSFKPLTPRHPPRFLLSSFCSSSLSPSAHLLSLFSIFFPLSLPPIPPGRGRNYLPNHSTLFSPLFSPSRIAYDRKPTGNRSPCTYSAFRTSYGWNGESERATCISSSSPPLYLSLRG